MLSHHEVHDPPRHHDDLAGDTAFESLLHGLISKDESFDRRGIGRARYRDVRALLPVELDGEGDLVLHQLRTVDRRPRGLSDKPMTTEG